MKHLLTLPLLAASLLAAACAEPAADGTPGAGTGAPGESSGTDAEPPTSGSASGATSPTADTLPPRPDTVESTIMLEGMEEPITLRLYRSPATFPVSFSTYVPTNMAAEPVATGELDAVRFVVEFGGVRNENAFLAVAVTSAGTDEAGARELARAFAAEHEIAERATDAPHRYDWSIEEWDFLRKLPEGGYAIGTVALGRHGERYFYVATHFPEEYAEGFGPRAERILDEWRWEDTGESLGEAAARPR